ncbi:hypothetical protein GF312_11595 [Candidatus Poribacteria bacterium]|nr:hypothetical protein [Candidatus Poribacteria bacterium]
MGPVGIIEENIIPDYMLFEAFVWYPITKHWTRQRVSIDFYKRLVETT